LRANYLLFFIPDPASAASHHRSNQFDVLDFIITNKNFSSFSYSPTSSFATFSTAAHQFAAWHFYYLKSRLYPFSHKFTQNMKRLQLCHNSVHNLYYR